MPKFTIVWTRVLQEDELKLDDVSVRETDTLENAESIAREINNGNNDHILLKIYDSELIDGRDPLELANEYFNLTHRRMLASLELLHRPIHKRKKKKSGP